MELSNSVALVSGGASGLGAATVRRLHAGGATVVIADRNAEVGGALAAELGARASFVALDVTDAATVQAAFEHARSLGPVRVAVNTAGVGMAMKLLNRDGSPHDLGVFEMVVRINLIGTFNVLRYAASAMAANEPAATGERGVVVNTASIAGYDGQIGQIAYATSKAGVIGMTLPAARDLMKNGIRVNTIAPGVFDTPLLAMLPAPAREALEATVPFPSRLGKPDEFAALVAAIVENPYLNGEVIRLDGALRMPPK
jgi:NAD(P)-dependent dehydrogenase (short-subunit alcohol dehydrogenase family)